MLLAVQQRDLQRRPRLPHPPVLVYLRRGNLLYLRPQTLPVYEVRFYAAAPALLGCSALLTIIIIIASPWHSLPLTYTHTLPLSNTSCGAGKYSSTGGATAESTCVE